MDDAKGTIQPTGPDRTSESTDWQKAYNDALRKLMVVERRNRDLRADLDITLEQLHAALNPQITPLLAGEEVRIPDMMLSVRDAGLFLTLGHERTFQVLADDSEVGISINLDKQGTAVLIQTAQRALAAMKE